MDASKAVSMLWTVDHKLAKPSVVLSPEDARKIAALIESLQRDADKE